MDICITAVNWTCLCKLPPVTDISWLTCVICSLCSGFAPTMMLQQPSRLAMSKVWMCDAPAAEDEAPAAEEKSVLDDLSAGNAALLEQIKGMTLLEASEVCANPSAPECSGTLSVV